MRLDFVIALDPALLSLLRAGVAADQALGAKLDLLSSKVDRLLTQGVTTMQELDDLKAQVASNTTVIGSAKTLILGFDARLAAALASPDVKASLVQLRADMKAQDDDLAAAVAANTPAATA